MADSGVLFDGYALSSIFGLNYDRSVDTQDNGKGAFGANTRDPNLKGVSLPEKFIREHIGDTTDPTVRAAITSGEYQVKVTTASGRSGLYALVDQGPAEWTGKGIDLTYGATRDLGINQNTAVHYQLIKKDKATGSQTQEEGSPLGQFRQKYPQYANIDDTKVLDKLYSLNPTYSKIDRKDFDSWMKSPTGGKSIQEAIAKSATPMEKLRAKYPDYASMGPRDFAKAILPIVRKKDPLITEDELVEKLDPKSGNENWAINWAKSAINFGAEVGKQIIPQSEMVGMQAWRGVSELENTAIDRNLDSAFGFAYPDAQTTEQKQALYSKYYNIGRNPEAQDEDNPQLSPYGKPGPYGTKLSDSDELAFEDWVKKNKVPWQDTPTADYDMRGFWKALVSGDPRAKQSLSQFDQHMHFPDTWKTPYNRTFSNESQYALPGAPHWDKQDRLVDSSGNVLVDESHQLSDIERQNLRDKAFLKDLNSSPGLMQRLQQKGYTVEQVLREFEAGMNGLDHRNEMEQTTKWMNKVVGDIDRDNRGTLPAEQEKAAKIIAQAPATVLMNVFPGIRELGNYSTLYDQNRQYLESKNPTLGKDKIDQMARRMADAQFPAQEVLALVLGRGGGLLTQGITNKLIKSGVELGLGAGTGAGVFTSNQLIRNLGSGDDWSKDLGESAFEGGLLGEVGAGTRLTIGGIKSFLTTSRDGRQVSGTLQATQKLSPKEANDFVAGGSNNGVSENVNGTALDLGFDAVRSNPEAMLDIVRRTVAKAEEERANGNNGVAAKKFDEAMALSDDTTRQKVTDAVRESVKTIAQKNVEPTVTKSTEWNELKPWQTAADIPRGAETKTDPSGKIFWKAVSGKKQNLIAAVRIKDTGQILTGRIHAEAYTNAGLDPGSFMEGTVESGWLDKNGKFVTYVEGGKQQGITAIEAGKNKIKQPNLDGFYGTDQAPGDHDPGPFSLGLIPQTPFAGMRWMKRVIGNFPGWHELEQRWNSIFAPERLSEQARITAQIGRGILASEKVASTQVRRILADEADLNSVIKNGVETERQEQFFHKYTNKDLADMTSAKQRGETLPDEQADKLFNYLRRVYDYVGARAKANGIKMGWLENYFSHSLKDKKEAEDFISKNQKMWGQPGFTKERHYPTLNDAITDGREPKTYNPVRNMLAYDAAVRSAIDKIQHLKQMQAVGMAWEEGKPMPELAQHYERVETADGKSYRVSSDTAQVLKNMYNINSVYDTIAGPWATFSGALKGFSGIKLMFPIFHAIHVSNVDTANVLASALYKAKNRILTGKDLQDILNSPVAFITKPGIKLGPLKWQGGYGELRDAMTGRLSKEQLENLSDRTKTDMRDLTEIGIIPHISHERQMQWAQFIQRMRAKYGAASSVMRVGYDFLTAKWFQRWWFQHVTPSLKIGRALMMRNTALQQHPDLYSNPKLRALEYDKIQRDVEGRYGEMNYDNLMWNQMAKQTGLNAFLSLGWNLGFWRIYGDAAVDLTNNVAHMDQIRAGISKQKEIVTERMLYAPIYSALGIATSLGITYMATGAIKSWWDGFFPRIGKKPNGDDDRVRTPFFTTEIASMAQHYLENAGMGGDPVKGVLGGGSEFLLNKIHSGLQDIYHTFVLNKDFRGVEISDHLLDYPTKQLPQKIEYMLKDLFTPIPVEPLLSPQHLSSSDYIAGFLGFSQAPNWTTRTALENEILDEFVEEQSKTGGKPQQQAKITDAKKEYQNALQTSQGIEQARANLHALGVNDKQIRAVEKNYKVPMANMLFKYLRPDAQKELLRRMNPSERASFLPYAHKDVKAWWRTEGERSLP